MSSLTAGLATPAPTRKPLDHCDECGSGIWSIADGVVELRMVRGQLRPFLIHHVSASPSAGYPAARRGGPGCSRVGKAPRVVAFLHLYLTPRSRHLRQLLRFRQGGPSAQHAWDAFLARLRALADRA